MSFSSISCHSAIAAVLGSAIVGPLFASAPASPASPSPAGVVASVNGEPILLEDLERRLGDMHREVGQTERAAFDVDQLVWRLVNDALFAQEARALGLDQDPKVVSEIAALRLKLAKQKLERVEIWDRVAVSDEEIREAFGEQYRRVTLRVISTHAKAEAEEILGRIREGADFDALARERSVDPYQLRGGLVESLPRIDLMKEIADVAFEVEPNTLFGPVATTIGWAVVRVESFEDADPERLETARHDLEEMIRFRKSQAARSELAARLRTAHPIRIHQEVLDAIVPDRLPDSRLQPKVDDPDAAVATVGSRIVRAGELGQELFTRWGGVRNEEPAAAMRPIVLERMIEDELVAAEALARGYDHAPEVDRVADAVERGLLVKKYLNDVLGPTVKVSSEQMRDYYAQNVDAFRQPPRVHVGQVTVASEGEARDVVALLKGGADLAWVAAKHSVDGYRDKGGDRGWMSPSPGLDTFQDALLRAEPGDVLGPFSGPEGWAVVKVTGKERRDPYPFEVVSGNVRSAVFQAEFQRVLDAAVQKLRSRSDIEIYETVLGSLDISGSRVEESGHGTGGATHVE